MSNFLKLEGITGESDNPWHIGEFDIISAVLNYTSPNQHTEFSRSGKVLGDVSVTRKQERDSNKLMSASREGKTFSSGQITLESTGKILILDMNNIAIIAYSLHKSIETISLAYGSLDIEQF